MWKAFCSPRSTIPTSHQSQVLHGCPLCGLLASSHRDWVVTPVNTLVDGADHCHCWLRGPAMTAKGLMVGGTDPDSGS